MYLTFFAAGSSGLNSGRSAARLVFRRTMASGANVAPSNSLRTNCRRDGSSSAAMMLLLCRWEVREHICSGRICSECLYSECICDVLHDPAVLRLGLRRVALQHLAVPPDQEFLEVPGDVAGHTGVG